MIWNCFHIVRIKQSAIKWKFVKNLILHGNDYSEEKCDDSCVLCSLLYTTIYVQCT